MEKNMQEALRIIKKALVNLEPKFEAFSEAFIGERIRHYPGYENIVDAKHTGDFLTFCEDYKK